jgi:two-component system phosphate regulon sensor histidine kinase PhoR
MSLSLVGIILVQLYWVNLSFKNSEEQFQYRAQNILNKVSDKIKDEEEEKFLKVFDSYRDSIGHEPTRNELLSLYVTSNKKNRSVLSTTGSFDSGVSGKQIKKKPAIKNYERPHLNNIELYLKDFREYNSVETWVSKAKVQEWISSELESKKIKTDVEFAIYKKSQPTKIESDHFRYIEDNLEEDQIFDDKQARVALILSFPQKRTFLINEILGMTLLSIIFTMVIIIAYLSAINQLIKQKQISEIKTDFINNMTHEFKTPIATINLALDAIKNPKIFIDPEKVQRYLQMIRDENKRMHAQVENVLQISKLDKRELDIPKDQADIHDVLEEAIEHINLIIEARHGILTRHFNALRTTALLNDVHFTNVLVNILDNAIKYSPDEPVIDIYTENVKDFILIKIKDNGLGMSKVIQKRIFEKFYREHTGDIHNVKGHGLGLAYVKRIIDDHNCHIYVESEKGKGSTFIIKMPLIN